MKGMFKYGKIEYQEIINGHHIVVFAYFRGHRCGYMSVDASEDYGDIECHGGISYDEMGDFGIGKKRYIGFDCHHAYDGTDFSIMDEKHKSYYIACGNDYNDSETIRTTEYVLNELYSMVKQLDEIGTERGNNE